MSEGRICPFVWKWAQRQQSLFGDQSATRGKMHLGVFSQPQQEGFMYSSGITLLCEHHSVCVGVGVIFKRNIFYYICCLSAFTPSPSRWMSLHAPVTACVCVGRMLRCVRMKDRKQGGVEKADEIIHVLNRPTRQVLRQCAIFTFSTSPCLFLPLSQVWFYF